MKNLPFPEDVLKAENRIREHISSTPVLTSNGLDNICGSELYFKCENLQKTGSFKFRGASNALQMFQEEDLPKSIATHSSGNHGAALARAATERGVNAQIVMPYNAPEVKQQAVQEYGGFITHCDSNLEARESTLKDVLKKQEAEEVPLSLIHI